MQADVELWTRGAEEPCSNPILRSLNSATLWEAQPLSCILEEGAVLTFLILHHKHSKPHAVSNSGRGTVLDTAHKYSKCIESSLQPYDVGIIIIPILEMGI